MVSTHGSVMPLAMFVDYVRIHLTVLIPLNSIRWNIDLFRKPKYLSHRTTFRICALLKKYYKISIPEWYEEKTQVWDRGTRKIFASKNVFKKMFLDSLESFRTFWKIYGQSWKFPDTLKLLKKYLCIAKTILILFVIC